jgi:outer membrane lipoprotein SlyB
MEVLKSPQRIHPLVATAAVALTLVSLVGVAAITGLLPTSNGAAAPQQQVAQSSTEQQAAVPARLAKTPDSSQSQSAPHNNGSVAPALAAICQSCGEVQAVRAVQHTPKASGVGIVAGAVLGGILGNQVGSGNGRTLATVAGAGAGGYAGNEVEKHSRTTTSYVVDVRMDNGKVRSFPQSGEGWRVGDQVRVVNGHLTSRG